MTFLKKIWFSYALKQLLEPIRSIMDVVIFPDYARENDENTRLS